MKFLLLILLTLPLFAEDLSQVVEKDLRQRAAADDLNALTELAFRYRKGEIAPCDETFVFESFSRAAKGGIARASTGLAICYDDGLGVERNDKEALRLFEMAAGRKDPEGLYHLGRRYYEGRSVPRDRVKARELYEESARLGFKLAQVTLLRASLAGDGVLRDLKALDELIRLAEDEKNAAAPYAVGMYYNGDSYSRGVIEPALARKYLTLAAERRHANAMIQLAKIELTPAPGKKMNAKAQREAQQKAAVWYRKGAELNQPDAMVKLAVLLQRNGNLRLKDEDWYQHLLKAERMGSDEAGIEMATINYHAPGYTFRDLDWSESAFYFQKYLDDRNAQQPGATFQYTHTAVHRLCELHYQGGLGLDRDYRKCLAVAQPFLGRCETATAYAGRTLLLQDAPLGNSREHFIRGYACMLSAVAQGYKISGNTLFEMRSRHNLTRDETECATRLVADGFPNPNTPLLP